jgi:hypothetical protein
MKKTIEETTRLLLQGTLTKDEADKILLDLHNVSISLERTKKYARHQHYRGSINEPLVEFEDWEVKDCC